MHLAVWITVSDILSSPLKIAMGHSKFTLKELFSQSFVIICITCLTSSLSWNAKGEILSLYWMLFSHTRMVNCNYTALHILMTNSYEFVQTHLYVFIQSACTSLREWIFMLKFSQLKPSKFATNMPKLKNICVF